MVSIAVGEMLKRIACGTDTKKAYVANRFERIPTLVKRGAPTHQQLTGGYNQILMQGCLII